MVSRKQQIRGRLIAAATAKGRQRKAAKKSSRIGALLSAELLIVMPILIIVIFGIVEVSLVLSGQGQLESAVQAAARFASLDSMLVEEECNSGAIEARFISSLPDQRMKNAFGQDGGGKFEIFVNGVLVDGNCMVNQGDMVTIRATMPMSAVAPDLLGVIGLALQGRTVTSTATVSTQS